MHRFCLVWNVRWVSTMAVHWWRHRPRTAIDLWLKDESNQLTNMIEFCIQFGKCFLFHLSYMWTSCIYCKWMLSCGFDVTTRWFLSKSFAKRPLLLCTRLEFNHRKWSTFEFELYQISVTIWLPNPRFWSVCFGFIGTIDVEFYMLQLLLWFRQKYYCSVKSYDCVSVLHVMS